MATYEGMGLCEPSEYHAAFESRLTHHQLTRGELYVARFKIDGLKVGFRILGRVGLIGMSDGESVRLNFHMLNDDMIPLDVPPEGTVTDGVWNSKDGVVYQPRPGAKEFEILNGCFASYEDGFGVELEAMLMRERERDLTPLV
jgi:hypothetical protein